MSNLELFKREIEHLYDKNIRHIQFYSIYGNKNIFYVIFDDGEEYFFDCFRTANDEAYIWNANDFMERRY